MMRNKVRWGVLGAAQIAVRKVIPAMQQGEWSEIAAIASRDRRKAEAAASALGIPKAYGSYEELLRDPEIEAVYNPLPNHLHVPWTLKAVEAGKHVLCEKPLSLTAEEARTLLAARDRTGVKIGEAFMVRTHPQWLRTREIIASGRDRHVTLDRGLLQLLQPGPRQYPQRRRVGWRRLNGHRLLPDHDLAFCFSRRTLAGDGADRTRSRDED